MYILVNSDYVVCTFSSNLCRLVYELKQINGLAAPWTVFSLDSDYFFDDNNTQVENAIHDHKPNENTQIELRKGDAVKLNFYVPKHLNASQIQNYLFDGFKNGTNLRTNQTGLFPSFKTM
jgi:glycoprotein 6-alpha-L-fucosyltransferase